MSDKVCLLCFSFSKATYNIKTTYLQNVYEEISETKIQANSYPLCYICYAKLRKWEQLTKTVQGHNNANQRHLAILTGVNPAPIQNLRKRETLSQSNVKQKTHTRHSELQLSVNVDRWSTAGQIDSEKIEIEIDIKKQYIKKEYVESPGHYNEASAKDQLENKQISIDLSCNKPHVCDVCNKRFTYISSFKKHRLMCTGVKPFHCEICSKTFSQSGSFKRHKLTHTGEKPYSCDVCSRSFNRKNNLKMHKLTHSGKTDRSEKPYSCDVCSKIFSKSSNLKDHKLIHSGEKPYSCDVCGKIFTKRCNLKTHKLVHSGERPYTCDICSKIFSKSCNLKTHKLIHSGEKPYSCDVCGKTFIQNSNLKAHKLKHSGEKPYSCDVCLKAYKRNENLIVHKFKHRHDV